MDKSEKHTCKFVTFSLPSPLPLLKLPVVRTRAAKKCTKMLNARAGREEPLFFFIKPIVLWCSRSPTSSFFRKRDRAPVAQLVEHRAVMREVVSSTPAGPTLRVLK